jgi:hypothetical protein
VKNGYCEVPGNTHRARNCLTAGCQERGECCGGAGLPGERKPARLLTRAEENGLIPIGGIPVKVSQFMPKGTIALMGPEGIEAVIRVPTDAQERKNLPICTGVLDYFPDALLEVARCSKAGNDQHNPGQPLHWAKEKSTDEPDALVRHLIDRGRKDKDGIRHSAKVAWRALALLQREIEAERQAACESE